MIPRISYDSKHPEGSALMEKALSVKSRHGVAAAVVVLESAGISVDLATIALVGTFNATKHGVTGFHYRKLGQS